MDGFGDPGLVRFGLGEAMDGVAHDQRRLGRVDDDDGLADLGAAHFLDGAGGGAGEFVDVLAGAGTGRLGRNGGDDFAVFDRLDPGDGGDHGDGGLTTTGDHVHVHFLFAHVFQQIDRGNAVGADGGGGEVDHEDAEGIELVGVLFVHVGAGGVEGDLDVVGLDVGQEAVDALVGGLQAQVPGTLHAFGGGINPHHPHRFQHRAALQFVEEIGADIAGTDQGTFDFFGHLRFSLEGEYFRRIGRLQCRNRRCGHRNAHRV